MKKNVFVALSIIVFTISTQSNAQSENGFFLSLNGGYNFPSGSVVFGSESKQISQTPDIKESERTKYSLGEGISFGIAAGYMFNRHVGTQLEVNYLLGSKTSLLTTQLDGFSDERSIYARMIQFNPSIIIAAGLDKINPYAKFGPVIGKGSIYREQTITLVDLLVDPPQANVSINKTTLDGGLALGVQAAVGVSVGLTTGLSLFGELNVVSMSYTPAKGKLTESTLNGIDQLPMLPISSIETEFVDVLTINSAITPPPSEPSKDVKQYFHFGSLGINIGLRYAL